MKPLKTYQEVDALFDQLFPLFRSITGEGLRQSLDILGQYMPLERLAFQTGEKVLNWSIPKEWSIREAYIENSKGQRIVDFKENNLHVASYSTPVHKRLTLAELKQHLYIHNFHEDAIPYVCVYYERKWGFCMTKRQFEALEDDTYTVVIDSAHFDGKLDIAHTKINGTQKKEVLLSSYLCHPSMANNELSGPIVLALLYQKIARWERPQLTYRFVLNPETIGSIAYLSRYGAELKQNLVGGFVLTCLGKSRDENALISFKKARNDESEINNVMHYFKATHDNIGMRMFVPMNGSDERQYCSPGFDLPVGQVSSLLYGNYSEYHTSLDTKEAMGIEALLENADLIEEVLKVVDLNGYYINKNPFGEVKLGDYNLYQTTSYFMNKIYENNPNANLLYMSKYSMIILNYSDGKHTLVDILSRFGLSFSIAARTIDALKKNDLLAGPFYEERDLLSVKYY